MHALEHLSIKADDVNLHVAAQGEGSLVLMIHGFPGLWYSWRHQLPVIANAGWRAVAMDQRGYGRSDRPVDPAAYDMNYVMRDALAILDYFGEKQAVFI